MDFYNHPNKCSCVAFYVNFLHFIQTVSNKVLWTNSLKFYLNYTYKIQTFLIVFIEVVLIMNQF